MTADADPWLSIAAARLPVSGLAMLAAARHVADVFVQFDGTFVWVHWPPGRLEIVRCLLPVTSVQFYRQQGDDWFRFAARLPTSERPPEAEKQPLASVILPDRMEPQSPTDTALSAVMLKLVRGGSAQPATALLCEVRDLTAWADTATTRELDGVKAAIHGKRVLLLGEKLPGVPNATRFWGDTVFVPIGFRVEPSLPNALIREAVGAITDELVFLMNSEIEIVPRLEFTPLSRPKLRLAIPPRTPALP